MRPCKGIRSLGIYKVVMKGAFEVIDSRQVTFLEATEALCDFCMLTVPHLNRAPRGNFLLQGLYHTMISNKLSGPSQGVKRSHTIPLGRPSAPAPRIQYRASNLDWQLVSYGRFGRMALKHVKYHARNELPVQVRCTILDAWGWCTGTTQRDGMGSWGNLIHCLGTHKSLNQPTLQTWGSLESHMSWYHAQQMSVN